VTGIRLLAIVALKRVLKAVMITGYVSRHAGAGLSGAYKTDLLIDAMAQFEHGYSKRPVLTSKIATIQCTGKKGRFNMTAFVFPKNWLLAKIRCISLINAPSKSAVRKLVLHAIK
jgi:hypothetical protein